MVELMEHKKKLTAGVILTLILAMSGTYFVAQDDDAYYCESRDIVMLCEKLSSGIGTRCYFENTYKTCKEGWDKIEIDQEINTQVSGNLEVPNSAEGTKWECPPNGVPCIKIS